MNATKADAKTAIAVITGGSRGLGRSMVLHLARKGMRSTFPYANDGAKADKVVSLAKEHGAQAIALQLDVDQSKHFATFAGAVRDALAQFDATYFDYLVNNAGTSHHALIADTKEEDFDVLYRVHLRGVFFLTKQLLPLMRDGGHIVNISSGLARFSYPGSAPYACMKGAVEALTRYLATELGPRKIKVNTVAPGAIATDFSGGMVRDNKEVNARIASMTALGRVGLPDDIGGMVASLLTGDNHFMTAQRLEVSGGVMI